MKKRKIAVVTGSRATYGYSRPVMRLIQRSEKLELVLIVTGMHLLKEYGLSVNEIMSDGFPIAARVDMMIGGDTASCWARSLGVEMQGLAQVFSMIEPDMILAEGDRGEQLAAVVAGAYMNIPVAHIQSGDVSGHIDGSARHAMTKLAHIHFPACADSAKRVERMGEEPWRIFNVGAPQLDEFVQGKRYTKEELENILNISLAEPTILVIQHPILIEVSHAGDQMTETMGAIKELGKQTIIVYPNVDAGGEEIIKIIKKYEQIPFVHAYKNIDRLAFLSLLRHIAVLAGNSSCGILEAPTVKLAAVNIGNRQYGRMQANNVINVSHERNQIIQAIQQALSDEQFKERLSQCVNPYGDGHSAARIVKVLEDIELGTKLLDKKIIY